MYYNYWNLFQITSSCNEIHLNWDKKENNPEQYGGSDALWIFGRILFLVSINVFLQDTL